MRRSYSESSGKLTIKGDETDIKTKSIIGDLDSTKTITIESGNYTEDNIVENDTETTKSDVVVKGGTFSSDVAKNYCEEGYTTTTDGSSTWTIAKIATWDSLTDSGFYTVNDEKFGMMRFSFKVTPTGDTKIKSVGIKYINASNLNAVLSTENAISADSVDTFYGDIISIPTTENGTYYAAAYMTDENGSTVWSKPVSCKINWTKYFENYQPKTTNTAEEAAE